MVSEHNESRHSIASVITEYVGQRYMRRADFVQNKQQPRWTVYKTLHVYSTIQFYIQ
jgi:hypothetical protein